MEGHFCIEVFYRLVEPCEALGIPQIFPPVYPPHPRKRKTKEKTFVKIDQNDFSIKIATKVYVCTQFVIIKCIYNSTDVVLSSRECIQCILCRVMDKNNEKEVKKITCNSENVSNKLTRHTGYQSQ